MKILIGTPVHQSKDYSIERWLKNVSQLTYRADLLIVDNSLGPDYAQKLARACQNCGIKNYVIKHLELPADQGKFERVAQCREIIRQAVLAGDYDAWFSWECDQIIPNNALAELERMLISEKLMMVNHNGWTKEDSDLPNFDWGVSLIKRQALEKYGFLLEFGTDPDMPTTWEPGERWFKDRILRGGDGFIEVVGVIQPIYHLSQ